MRAWRLLVALATVFVVLGQGGPARASEFGLQEVDGKAEGMSNAFMATADNPSANFFNPAGMSQLDGFQAEVSGVYIENFTHYRGDAPGETEANTKEIPNFFPAVFASYAITDQINVGLGVFVPFGLSERWPEDWSGRYIVRQARIQTVEVNPNVSYKIPFAEGHSLSLAAGVGVIRTALMLEQAINLSGAGANDGDVKLFGDDDDRLNLVWNAGFLLSLFDRKVRLGFLYRSACEPQIHGTAEFSSPTNPQTGQPLVQPTATRAYTRFWLPDSVRAGVAFQPIDPLTLEVDFTWTHWSKLDKVFIELDSLGRTNLLDFGCTDAYFVGFGVDYKIVPDFFSARAGVFFDGASTRLDTRSPEVPDHDREGFSVGVGVSPIKQVTIDAGFLTDFIMNAYKSNSVGADAVPGGVPRANGHYDTFVAVGVISVIIKF